jgi:hypothetical protein
MEFMAKHFDSTAIERISLVAETPFRRLPYTGQLARLLVWFFVLFFPFFGLGGWCFNQSTALSLSNTEAIDILLAHVEQGKKKFEVAVGKPS